MQGKRYAGYSLVPPATAAVFRVRKWVAILCPAFAGLLIAPSVACGLIRDVQSLLVTIGVCLLFEGFFLYPVLCYYRLSQSVLDFDPAQLQVFDHRGRCWRVIPVETVTEIRVVRIYGELYGTKKDEVEGEYLCFFLNGIRELPNTSYAKLFCHENCLTVFCQEVLKANLPEPLRSKLRPCGAETFYT